MVALSSSIDAFGIGTSYGIRKIKITGYALIIISAIAFIFSYASILFGNVLLNILPVKVAKLIGILILIFMGVWIILQGNKKDEKVKEYKSRTIFSLLIKSLGITIEIIRTPEKCDMDKSNKIEIMEAFYLGIAMSVDSIGAGIGSAVLGVDNILLPASICLFQFIFLLSGIVFAEKLVKLNINNNNIWIIISGSLLIIIAMVRLILV